MLLTSQICRFGQEGPYFYGEYTAFLAGKLPNTYIHTYTAVYGSGQPYTFDPFLQYLLLRPLSTPPFWILVNHSLLDLPA